MISQNILVLCSCPDANVAEALSQTLVRERLAACVNRISALRSTYEWEGKVQDEPEVLLLIKTTGARYEALELRIKALHPYEVPEIIAVPIVAGSGSYLAWLARGSGGERSPAPEVATER